MNWQLIESPDQVKSILEESFEKPVIIFKHSTRCSISRATLDRLERNWKQDELPESKIYFLDLLSYREISNAIAEILQVEHESPQLILLRNGKPVYFKSHFDIEYTKVKDALRAVSAPVIS